MDLEQRDNRGLLKSAHLTSLLSKSSGGLHMSVSGLVSSLSHLQNVTPYTIGVLDPLHPRDADDWGPNVMAHKLVGPRFFQYAPGMVSSLLNTKPDVIDLHGIWNYASLACITYHDRTGTPYVISPHGMLDRWARENSRWKKNIAGFLYAQRSFQKAAVFRATSEMEAEHIRSFGVRQPIAIVPHGITVAQSVELDEAPQRQRVLLFLSRLHPKKGLPFLIRAWASICRVHTDWKLVIAGPDEGGHEGQMKELARQLNADRIEWRGEVTGAEKDGLISGSDLFVLPTHAENFGMVIAEALAAGVPVITTRNAPWAGLEQYGCGWWVPLRYEAIVDALLAAMALHPLQLKQMGAAGRLWMMRDFGWGNVADKMARLYNWTAFGGPVPDFVNR